MSKCQILTGDCFEVLPTLEANSVDAIVTDPPYALGFMNRKWDTFTPANAARIRQQSGDREIDARNPNLKGRGHRPAFGAAVEYDRRPGANARFQEWCREWAAQAIRVLKPGGYMLVCMSPRTQHRAVCGFEDAGFEILDQIKWMYGQGMPKSVDVGRAIDMDICEEPGRHWMRKLPEEKKRLPNDHVCAETEAGREWAGWGTGLRPCYEPVCVAKKPTEGTIAGNVQNYGTGGMNVDACRLDTKTPEREIGQGGAGYSKGWQADSRQHIGVLGRWPPNVAMDEAGAAMVDEQSGQSVSRPRKEDSGGRVDTSQWRMPGGESNLNDRGGASRFFYCQKTSRNEREEGCEHLPIKSAGELTGGRAEDSEGIKSGRAGAGRSSGGRRNHHPTVKPIKFMRWLVRLVTPPGGTVLDPFFGSGTTGIACELEDFSYIGIEKEVEYVPIAEARIAHARKQIEDERRAFNTGGPLFAGSDAG